MKIKTLLILFTIICITKINAQNNQSTEGADAEYTRVLIGRVNKFLVDIIDTFDTEKYIRVRDIIVQQYKYLSKIHDSRDEVVKAIRSLDSLDKETLNFKVDATKNEATKQIYELHCAYIGKLTAELTSDQIDQVKDGMTYGVLPRTYHVYLEMLPDLTEGQKRVIMAWLVEARELAIDAGSSDKKHNIFGKYKGKINNYLSKAGYDLKQAEKDMYERQKNKEKK